MLTQTRIPLDRLVWNVKIFDALLIDEWKEKDAVVDWDVLIEGIDIDKDPNKWLHAIIMLLKKRGQLRFKPPRSLAD